MTSLTPATLETIRGAAIPNYDRSKISTGIVHIGVGGFHRAHQAMVVDKLMRDGLAFDWGICGIGVLPQDDRMRDALTPQRGLYTLVLKKPDGTREVSIIGSIVEYLFAPDDPETVIEKLAHESTRIVSLTITEGGYNVNQVTGKFQADTPEVARDAVPGKAPTTVFGLVVEGLRRRWERGVPAFTIMSCDNVQGNGHVARHSFVSFARLVDKDLAEWIDAEVAFPNSMVDRVTPVTTSDDLEEVEALTGVADAWPVVCEPYFQWVLEDHFSLGRPEFERVDVNLVDDVEPYELMKLRLLNASHQALCYFGYLAGYRYVHEAASDPLLESLLRRYMVQEGTPTLRPVPGIDIAEYRDTLILRFRNAEVKDTLTRLCAESSDRIPKWLLPVVRENLSAGRAVELSAAIVASWARYARGTDESGDPIAIVDRLRDRVVAAAQPSDDPLLFLRDAELFGGLADEAEFVEPYLKTLDHLDRLGALATLEHLLDTEEKK